MKKFRKILSLAMVLIMMAALTDVHPPFLTDGGSAASDAAKNGWKTESTGLVLPWLKSPARQSSRKPSLLRIRHMHLVLMKSLFCQQKIPWRRKSPKSNDLITSACDVIAIYSADADGVVPAVQACNEAGFQ